MDIYILRDGKEIGPFSEETTQTLLKQGSVAIGDLAWSPGMAKWVPLHDVLYPAPPPPPPQTPPPHPTSTEEAPLSISLPKGEPATAKQKALLSYLGISFSPDLTKDQAAILVNDAMEEPKHTGRLAQWNKERFTLHPDLFASEMHERKENRATHYYELCQGEGAEYFTKVTKAHTQVLIGYLDVKFPNWDAREDEAAWNYFYPAIAEKFPQLVNKGWKDKFKYATGPKVAAGLTRRPSSTPIVVKAKTPAPVAALVRGVFFGAIILGMLFFGKKVLDGGGEKAKTDTVTAASPAPKPDLPALPPIAKNENPNQLQPIDALPPVAPADMPAKLAANPLADAPPMAEPKPVDPFAPPMAATAPADPFAAPAAPADPFAVPVAPVAPIIVPGMALRVTKPVEVQLAFGKAKLIAGTAVKLVSQEGANLRVNYLNSVIVIPAASTNIDAVPAPAPMAPAPATTFSPAPAPATPAPRGGDSLFGAPPLTNLPAAPKPANDF